MGRHHKPRRDRLGGRRSGDLGRHIYVSVCVWVVVGGSGGDGGEMGGGRGVRKERLSLWRENTESEETTTANLRLQICIHTLILPWPLGNGANPPFGVVFAFFNRQTTDQTYDKLALHTDTYDQFCLILHPN